MSADSGFHSASLRPTEQEDRMTSLIERLEAAEVGTRALDAELEVAIRGIEAARTGLAREHWAKWRFNIMGLVGDDHTQYQAAPVTTSLDAALALAERVLPGWWVEVRCRHMPDDSPRQKWSAEVEWPEPVIVQSYGETVSSHEFYHAFAATPALALCIAVLKATQSASTSTCGIAPLGDEQKALSNPADRGAGND